MFCLPSKGEHLSKTENEPVQPRAMEERLTHDEHTKIPQQLFTVHGRSLNDLLTTDVGVDQKQMHPSPANKEDEEKHSVKFRAEQAIASYEHALDLDSTVPTETKQLHCKPPLPHSLHRSAELSNTDSDHDVSHGSRAGCKKSADVELISEALERSRRLKEQLARVSTDLRSSLQDAENSSILGRSFESSVLEKSPSNPELQATLDQLDPQPLLKTVESDQLLVKSNQLNLVEHLLNHHEPDPTIHSVNRLIFPPDRSTHFAHLDGDAVGDFALLDVSDRDSPIQFIARDNQLVEELFFQSSDPKDPPVVTVTRYNPRFQQSVPTEQKDLNIPSSPRGRQSGLTDFDPVPLSTATNSHQTSLTTSLLFHRDRRSRTDQLVPEFVGKGGPRTVRFAHGASGHPVAFVELHPLDNRLTERHVRFSVFTLPPTWRPENTATQLTPRLICLNQLALEDVRTAVLAKKHWRSNNLVRMFVPLLSSGTEISNLEREPGASPVLYARIELKLEPLWMSDSPTDSRRLDQIHPVLPPPTLNSQTRRHIVGNIAKALLIRLARSFAVIEVWAKFTAGSPDRLIGLVKLRTAVVANTFAQVDTQKQRVSMQLPAVLNTLLTCAISSHPAVKRLQLKCKLLIHHMRHETWRLMLQIATGQVI
ncbi:uncharacterized protein DEA37_0007722 [Paragonimus westermani]|uniref:Uncharacterized protein n=1 Tax=Paragonimus westermani TaxID=34504 RepID=A0A5J4NTK5_9TREM|nr:uncharacterized protein DEA37_0007722 [Paragonimus westermani]